MDNFIKMDVFFVVTTAAVVMITAMLTVLFVRIYSILKDVERISKNVSAESDLIRTDIADIREVLRREGFRIQMVLSSLHTVLQKFFRRQTAK